ncbi:MAG TPA: hypothetical protein VK966_10735 [Longimicrobiales bacterium]|nr:hypothetical protein [Longimicrobiales bacterium]
MSLGCALPRITRLVLPDERVVRIIRPMTWSASGCDRNSAEWNSPGRTGTPRRASSVMTVGPLGPVSTGAR